MKARVKATGEIVELHPYCEVYEKQKEPFKSKKHKICHLEGIEIFEDPDYWTRLEHQYAGMAMQGILSNQDYCRLLVEENIKGSFAEDVSRCASGFAHALVKKMKGD
jgi:hypothetical protein